MPRTIAIVLLAGLVGLSCDKAPEPSGEKAVNRFDELIDGGDPHDLVALVRNRIRFEGDQFILLTEADQLIVRVCRFKKSYEKGKLRAWFTTGTYGPKASRDFRDIGCPSISSAVEESFGLGSGEELKAIEEAILRALDEKPQTAKRLQQMIDEEFGSIDRRLAEHIRAHLSDYIHHRMLE